MQFNLPKKKELINRMKFRLQYSLLYVSWFAKWLVFGAITGVVCGLVGAVFHMGIDWATAYRTGHDWMIFLLPFAGLLIVFCYHVAGLPNDPGTNLVLASIQSKVHIPIKLAPLIFIGTVITHLFGGSSGREGAALQIGGSIGEALGHIFRLRSGDITIIIICGMAGVFASLFGTPIAATVFSMEVVSVGVIHYSAFVPAIVSSAIAYGITVKFGIAHPVYPTLILPELNVFLFLKVIMLAMVCGLVSMLFCWTIHEAAHAYKKTMVNDYVRIFIGGCMIIALTLLCGTRLYNGQGSEGIMLALTGESPKAAFLLKIIFTAITIGAGFKGGEIIPAIFVGASLGNVVAPLLGMDPGLGAALGMVALFCSVVNCPLASILLSIEMFGHSCVLLFCVACAVSYVFSGYYGLYSNQEIMYDKLHPQSIKTHSH